MSSARSSDRIGRVGLPRNRLQHVQEIARKAQAFGRRHGGLALAGSRGICSQGRSLRDDAVHLSAADGRIRDVVRLGIERAQCAKGRNQRAHRMRVLGQAVKQAGQSRRRHAAVVNRRRERLQLRRGWQFALDHQPRRLEKRALLGQLLDRIPAIAQDALVAVDERDGAATGRRVHQRRVVGHQAEVVGGLADLAQVGRTDGVVLDGELVAVAGAVVCDRQRVCHAGVGGQSSGQPFRAVSGMGSSTPSASTDTGSPAIR